MKFLALVATCAALSLRATVQKPQDIVKYFLKMGSADAIMAAVDTNCDGTITLPEFEQGLKANNADKKDVEIAKGLFFSISRGKASISKEQLESFEAGVKMILEEGCQA